MELTYHGGNCLKLSSKKASLVFDDNLADIGLATVTKPGDIALFTAAHGSSSAEVKLVIDHPGEYEVSDVSVNGVAARAHIDEADSQTATMFRIVADDVRIVVLGHIFPELSENQLEALGTVDVLIIPVGGNGYTLDPIGALKLIKKIEPKMVIPTHYAEKGVSYPVPQRELADALKEMAMEPAQTVPKLKLKAGEMGDTTQLIVLEKQ